MDIIEIEQQLETINEELDTLRKNSVEYETIMNESTDHVIKEAMVTALRANQNMINGNLELIKLLES